MVLTGYWVQRCLELQCCDFSSDLVYCICFCKCGYTSDCIEVLSVSYCGFMLCKGVRISNPIQPLFAVLLPLPTYWRAAVAPLCPQVTFYFQIISPHLTTQLVLFSVVSWWFCLDLPEFWVGRRWSTSRLQYYIIIIIIFTSFFDSLNSSKGLFFNNLFCFFIAILLWKIFMNYCMSLLLTPKNLKTALMEISYSRSCLCLYLSFTLENIDLVQKYLKLEELKRDEM